MADRPIPQVLSGTLLGAPGRPGVSVCTVAESMQTGGDKHTEVTITAAAANCIDYHQQSSLDLELALLHIMQCIVDASCSVAPRDC